MRPLLRLFTAMAKPCSHRSLVPTSLLWPQKIPELPLVRPLGFALDDRRLRRAGLDHYERQAFEIHDDLDAAIEALGPRRWLVVETSGSTRYDRIEYRPDDVLLFGPETRGLPDEVLARFAVEDRVKIPQRDAARSLNRSNAAAVVFYEAWRQLGFG